MYINEKDEVKIYHIFCDISRSCRNYFWLRNHMPNDGWNIDNEVGAMLSKLEKLEKTFKTLKEKYPEEVEEWDIDQM